MEHLSAAALARLIDELPATDERRHLDACEACQLELQALREQSEAISRLPDVRPARGDWEALEARLLSEGLIEGASRPGYGELARTPVWMKAAAAVVLFLAGMATGVAGLRGGLPGLMAGATPAATSLAALGLGSGAPASVEEAARRVRYAESGYIEALTDYREILIESGANLTLDDPARRYAALEALVRVGRAAVREAPADPFLNGLLASALAERQAVVRHISARSADGWF